MTSSLGAHKLVRVSLLLLLVALGLHLAYELLLVPVVGHDDFLHLTWLEDFVRLRASGVSIPHWLPESNGRLGSPTFYFYPPLTYYLADFHYVVGIRSASLGTVLFHAVSLMTLVLSGGAMYWYLRNRRHSAEASLLGALLYTVVPYRYADIFTRSALGEHVAFIWIPLLLIAMDQAIDGKDRTSFLRSLILSAIAWSGLMLTNIPATVVTAIVAACYAIPGLRSNWKALLAVLGGGVLAALIAAFYLLPLTHFRDYIQTENLWNFDVAFSKWHHALIEAFDATAKRTAILLVAIITLLVAGLLIARFFRSRRSDLDRSTKGLLLAGVACVLLQLPFISDPVWNIAMPLQLLQFSWRFCIGLVLITAGLFASAIDLKLAKTSVLLFLLAVISLTFYVRYGYIISTYPAPPDQVGPLHKSANEYVNRYVRMVPDSFQSFATSMMKEPVLSASRPCMISKIYENADTLLASISADSNIDLYIKRMWWPEWQLAAVVNGREVNIPLAPDPDGLIVARNVMPGAHELRLTMRESNAERRGKTISLIGVGIFSALCIAGYIHTRKNA